MKRLLTGLALFAFVVTLGCAGGQDENKPKGENPPSEEIKTKEGQGMVKETIKP